MDMHTTNVGAQRFLPTAKVGGLRAVEMHYHDEGLF